jgi:hypothetical protein
VKPQSVIVSIVICGAVCLAGIGYLWGKTEVWQLSREIKKLELRRDELKRNNNVLQREYAVMCAPAMLAARVRELNLGLASPSPDQILRLKEPAPDAQANEPRIYAANTNE